MRAGISKGRAKWRIRGNARPSGGRAGKILPPPGKLPPPAENAAPPPF